MIAEPEQLFRAVVRHGSLDEILHYFAKSNAESKSASSEVDGRMRDLAADVSYLRCVRIHFEPDLQPSYLSGSSKTELSCSILFNVCPFIAE